MTTDREELRRRIAERINPPQQPAAQPAQQDPAQSTTDPDAGQPAPSPGQPDQPAAQPRHGRNNPAGGDTGGGRDSGGGGGRASDDMLQELSRFNQNFDELKQHGGIAAVLAYLAMPELMRQNMESNAALKTLLEQMLSVVGQLMTSISTINTSAASLEGSAQSIKSAANTGEASLVALQSKAWGLHGSQREVIQKLQEAADDLLKAGRQYGIAARKAAAAGAADPDEQRPDWHTPT